MGFPKGHKGYNRKSSDNNQPMVETVTVDVVPVVQNPAMTTTEPETIVTIMAAPEFPLNFIKVPKSAINWGNAYPVFNSGGSSYEKHIRQLYSDGYHLHSTVALSSTELLLTFEK